MSNIKAKNVALLVSTVALLIVAAYWVYQNRIGETHQGIEEVSHAKNDAMLDSSDLSKDASSKVSGSNDEHQVFGINDFFKAKSAAEAMSLLPQLSDIDAQTRTEMVMELNNLCLLSRPTSKPNAEVTWLENTTNRYCTGFTAMDVGTFQSQGTETKSHYISAALRETFKKDGPIALDESIGALVQTSKDPYERSEALTFAAQNNIPLKALEIGSGELNDIEAKDILHVAAQITFCKNNSACDTSGLRSLLTCYSYNECSRATPALEQLQQRTSPRVYSAASSLVTRLEGN